MGELNLLPYGLRKRQISSIKKKKYFAIISIAIVSLVLAFCIPLVVYMAYVNKDNDAQEKLSDMQVMYNKNKKIETAINADNSYLKSVDMMTKEKCSTKDTISLFQNFMTKDIYFRTFAYNRTGVQISGSAKNYNSPSEFAANMQLSGKFADVKLTNVNVTKDGVDFNISITY